MSIDSDYARAAAYLSQAHLTPYVSYVEHSQINGLHDDAKGRRVVVRVSDGKVVSSDGEEVDVNVSGRRSANGNPVADAIFNPACYRATAERTGTFAGAPAIAFSLQATCRSAGTDDRDYALATLYADPRTFEPLDVNGAILPSDESKNVRVALDERFAEFAGRVMPSALSVDVAGSGWMFWLQVHVHQTYGDYRFLERYDEGGPENAA